MKYGVVGSHVNLTSRIQSYTTGGQILISDAARREAGHALKTGTRTEVKAKGIEYPVTLYEVLGIGRPYKLDLPESSETLLLMSEEIHFKYEILEASHLSGETYNGTITKLSRKWAEARLERPVPILSNLQMKFVDSSGRDISGAGYGKVMGTLPEDGSSVSIRFTSAPPDLERFLHETPSVR
jgi:adenylate cyclase